MSSITMITGASSGIGRAMSKQLNAQGCRVVVTSRGNCELLLRVPPLAVAGGP